MPVSAARRTSPNPNPNNRRRRRRRHLSAKRLQAKFTTLVTDSGLESRLRARLRNLSRADADDRAQEGLAAAWRAFINKYRREGVLLEARHLIWIAIRTAHDTRRRLVGGDDSKDALAPPNRKALVWYPDVVALQRAVEEPVEVREDVRRYMARARPEERDLLVLRAEGRSWTEVGAQLGLTSGCARRRALSAARSIRRRAQRRA